MFGKKNRLARIMNPENGKSLVMAMDHGMVLGPTRGIEKPDSTLKLLEGFMNAVIINKGILTTAFVPDGKTGIILRVSGGPTIIGNDLSTEGITTSVEEALRLGVDGVIINVFVGTENESSSLISFARMADECHKYGLPVIGATAVGKDKEKHFDPDYVKLSARVVAEFGADIVKTYYTGERFEEVVEGCPAPILLAGGPHADTDEETLIMVTEALEKGAAGIAMGRRIWQSEDPRGMIKALYGIIHQDWSVEEAISSMKK
ncbi:MAG: 3-hydroxy-5-phosphonooxypentane-2,4-dione thiolase [Halanaerobiales bacterium]|nr:3-hydroxy-5-phosphonooxypentane-2,4-dione thiolase [Halanaerobiales bacterium]